MSRRSAFPPIATQHSRAEGGDGGVLERNAGLGLERLCGLIVAHLAQRLQCELDELPAVDGAAHKKRSEDGSICKSSTGAAGGRVERCPLLDELPDSEYEAACRQHPLPFRWRCCRWRPWRRCWSWPRWDADRHEGRRVARNGMTRKMKRRSPRKSGWQTSPAWPFWQTGLGGTCGSRRLARRAGEAGAGYACQEDDRRSCFLSIPRYANADCGLRFASPCAKKDD